MKNNEVTRLPFPTMKSLDKKSADSGKASDVVKVFGNGKMSNNDGTSGDGKMSNGEETSGNGKTSDNGEIPGNKIISNSEGESASAGIKSDDHKESSRNPADDNQSAARQSNLSREQALALLKKYNKEPFHIQHALTVEGVMRWYAKELGYAAEEEFWGITGLLHDIDFELYPEEHCQKAPELLREAGVGEDMIYAICSHGYGICSEQEPKHTMEKVLFASDELTGLIWSCALMRPSKSTMDMEVKSLKKKFKDKKFAAGCSREIIAQGAQMLGWELDELFDRTILAMRSCEAAVAEAMRANA